MNKQGCLLAVLEVIIAIMAIMAIATVARQEVRELLKVTEEALMLLIVLAPKIELLLGHLVNLAERQELVVVVRVALLQSTAESIVRVEKEIELELEGDVEAVHQSDDSIHAVGIETTVEVHNVVNTVLLDFVLHGRFLSIDSTFFGEGTDGRTRTRICSGAHAHIQAANSLQNHRPIRA